MATPSLATVGGQEFPVGYPGQLAFLPGGQPEIETRMNENATAIDFGAGVCRGTAVAPGTIGNTRPAFNPGVVIGFAVRALSEANTAVSAGTVNYPQYSPVPILKDGLMWVTAAAEGATEGDAAVIVVATPSTVGSATGGAANGTTRLATSAVWQQTVAGGAVGLIRVKSNV